MAENRPDKITVYPDAKGEFRWTRRNGHNNLVVSDSSEGYTEEDHAIQMAYDINGGDFVVQDLFGNVIPDPRL
jgi:uncharacterized protein YegP (UPF0339 family)